MTLSETLARLKVIIDTLWDEIYNGEMTNEIEVIEQLQEAKTLLEGVNNG